MVAERPMGEPSKHTQASPIYQEVNQIKTQIDTLAKRIQKETSWSPSRDELDTLADKLIGVCNAYHNTITPWDRHLKTAIIDLTEVPIIMGPELQRYSFATALKDASQSLSRFLMGSW